MHKEVNYDTNNNAGVPGKRHGGGEEGERKTRQSLCGKDQGERAEKHLEEKNKIKDVKEAGCFLVFGRSKRRCLR